MADAPTIQVDIVSAEGELFSGPAAVVFAPLQSNIMETRNFAKNFARIAPKRASPRGMLEPPTKSAVFFLSCGERVKMAPSTKPPTLSAFTPP